MVSSKRMIGCKTKKERRNGALRLAAAALAVGVIVPIARVDSLGTMKVYASSAVSTELAAQIAAYTEAAGAQSTGVDPASASVIAATDSSAACAGRYECLHERQCSGRCRRTGCFGGHHRNRRGYNGRQCLCG